MAAAELCPTERNTTMMCEFDWNVFPEHGEVGEA